jgi:hypothetical protein
MRKIKRILSILFLGFDPELILESYLPYNENNIQIVSRFLASNNIQKAEWNTVGFKLVNHNDRILVKSKVEDRYIAFKIFIYSLFFLLFLVKPEFTSLIITTSVSIFTFLNTNSFTAQYRNMSFIEREFENIERILLLKNSIGLDIISFRLKLIRRDQPLIKKKEVVDSFRSFLSELDDLCFLMEHSKDLNLLIADFDGTERHIDQISDVVKEIKSRLSCKIEDEWFRVPLLKTSEQLIRLENQISV